MMMPRLARAISAPFSGFAVSATVGLFFAVGAGLTTSAHAGDGQVQRLGSMSGGVPSTAPATTKQNWREKTEASCGMACRYHRANDNLTLQALYLITKMKKIDEALGNGEETRAKTALGGFCTDSGEEAEACFDRYKAFQRVALLQIRQAIGKNEEMIARLTSGRKNDGTVEGDTVSFGANADPEAYVPEVPTVSELEKAYLDGKLKPTGSKYSAAEIQKWSVELVGIAPNGQRFLEFNKKTVDGNPHQAEKTKYQLHMIARDGSGAANTDAAAVKAVQGSQKAIKEVADNQVQLGVDAKVIGPKDIARDDSVSHSALKEARSILNSRIAGALAKDGASRAPAGKSAPDSKNAASTSAKEGAASKSAANPQSTSEKSADPKSTAALVSSNAASDAQDLSVKRNTASDPKSYREYADEERVQVPEKVDQSRYIRYNLNELFTDIEDSTK
jgi:hypothetical protein